MASKHKFVNGPINVVHLTGSVGKIEKSIYLFMDFHIQHQTKCENIRSIDVDKFFIDTYDRAAKNDPKKIYDFFMERGPLEPYTINPKEKGIYIETMIDIFYKSFKINLTKNKVLKSDTIPNVRFHHVDIRDYVVDLDVYYNIIRMADNLWDQKGYSINSMRHLYQSINDAIQQSRIYKLYEYTYKNMIKTNPILKKKFLSTGRNIKYDVPLIDLDNMAKKAIYKLRYAYQHDSIKKNINEIMDSDLLKLYNALSTKMENLMKHISGIIKEHEKYGEHDHRDILLQQIDGTYDYGISKKIILDNIRFIYDTMKEIANIFMDIGVMYMDLFLLRRFLDKDYVKHASAYTGAFHSVDYIRLLIKYFGFEITHYSYLKNNNIKQAHDMAKKSSSMHDMTALFYPVIFLQCSDLGSFPEDLD